MTDRIQELSKQARKYAQQYVNESVIPYGKTASEFERIFESKFAELIVREGADQLDDGSENGMWSRSVLFKHFGVK